MPNLVAHFGLHGIVTRALLPGADLRWVLLGALLPDAPWILQRVLQAAFADLDRLDLRLYSMVQASLAFSLLMGGGVALLTRRPARVFAILALGSALHLLLDATQTKWGNGVHLFAPWSWELWNAGLYWPESAVTLAMTALGLVWAVWAWRRQPGERYRLDLRPGRRTVSAGLLLAAYLALPFPLLGAAEAADAHFVGTLRAADERTGKPIAFDRAWFEHHGNGADPVGSLYTFAGERLSVASRAPTRSGFVSVKGRFRSAQVLDIDEVHLHAGAARDLPTYAGLLILAAAWVRFSPGTALGRLWPRAKRAPPV
jgi:hypothetical protein